jgi:tRNA-2-methylthio-N6-dimethylallyladenosine synthase
MSIQTISLAPISEKGGGSALITNKDYQNKGLFVQTYGCQMNEYDSQKIGELLQQSHGLNLVDDTESAEVAIVNTCSVREKAQEKVFTLLGRWKKWKEKKAGRIICVGGCVASQEGELIRRRAPFVDIVFGPQTLHRLPQLLEQTIKGKQSHLKIPLSMDISFPEVEKFDRLPIPVANGVSAFVSIMEGCSKYCSFCVVPYTRGEEFSRPYLSVMEEVRELSRQGVREVTLLGQNVNAYIAEFEDGSPCDFSTLLTEVATIEHIDRLRFTTSHPMEMTNDIIQCFQSIPQLANQLHLPVQSGSDSILNRMKRGYTALEYKNIIRRLREIKPDIHLSSDFIVGFPGETEEDFMQTYRLVEEVKFSRSFSFIYSARPGTPASALPDDVPLETKKQRLYRLQELLAQQTEEIENQLVGTTQAVLIERLSRKSDNQVAGRADNNVVVNFSADTDLIGQFVEVKITERLTNSFRGVLL